MSAVLPEAIWAPDIPPCADRDIAKERCGSGGQNANVGMLPPSESEEDSEAEAPAKPAGQVGFELLLATGVPAFQGAQKHRLWPSAYAPVLVTQISCTGWVQIRPDMIDPAHLTSLVSPSAVMPAACHSWAAATFIQRL